MFRRTHGDSGQAFPIYITVVAGLLFLAFAYLAVGQAAVNRGGAQTAADAAVLAAAQNGRDQLAAAWATDLLDPDKWQDVFEGKVPLDNPCGRAEQLAAQNDATLQDCNWQLLRYTVDVETNKSVGESVVPGTEDVHSSASATAVIEPRCTFPEDPGEGDELPELTCDGKPWKLDPDDEATMPAPEDLFDVHLAAD
ncbi:pilus assembly protein TadG-related protein [Streptomyces sp. Go40/10]|uniref:pilus assembly protein TadG-related protein n=1 Tax=Streptomyces sp. Go40/10 TaxID=2825844 RepID=UPI002738932C|nr:pilus assembly protein TadG-related protein [Streptomyces sp. Go40/10]UFR07384.1 pilus assembly protein TadG-related protein [Streptomyces sp. Go40/10]